MYPSGNIQQVGVRENRSKAKIFGKIYRWKEAEKEWTRQWNKKYTNYPMTQRKEDYGGGAT